MPIIKGSVYENVPRFTGSSFRGLRAKAVEQPEPILEHVVVSKARLDAIAHEYFARSNAWRRIADANADVLFPEDLIVPDPLDTDHSVDPDTSHDPEGDVILIPRGHD